MSHTPGPWNVEANRDVRVITGSDGNLVCEFSFVNEREESNARLIAAAPDLLDALCSALSALQVATTPLPEDRQEVLAAQAKARAAIAKAQIQERSDEG